MTSHIVDEQNKALTTREIHARKGIGIAAHVIQGNGLEVRRIHVQHPSLIIVEKGSKSVRADLGDCVQAKAGQAILLGGNQILDFTNLLEAGMTYEARWLVFDVTLLEDSYYRCQAEALEASKQSQAPVRLIPEVRDSLRSAFGCAWHALVSGNGIPDAVARQRALEVLHWLMEEGIALRNPKLIENVSRKVRDLITQSLDYAWTAERIARELALSEATLRRRLAAEGNTLTDLLVDVRMATALTLLQATTQPVSAIALALGYESPSRFAIRFRQRFGFAPTTVRGHQRAC
ncbi:helix-turn-helix transcriptional regulator [Undibacterium sp. Di27W]|uniref:AraC family transcriptional regulator n=1 Tax=Undibacterium sp. Di27W TaxID=3413036 RepID=UPI003BF355CA